MPVRSRWMGSLRRRGRPEEGSTHGVAEAFQQAMWLGGRRTKRLT